EDRHIPECGGEAVLLDELPLDRLGDLLEGALCRLRLAQPLVQRPRALAGVAAHLGRDALPAGSSPLVAGASDVGRPPFVRPQRLPVGGSVRRRPPPVPLDELRVASPPRVVAPYRGHLLGLWRGNWVRSFCSGFSIGARTFALAPESGIPVPAPGHQLPG